MSVLPGTERAHRLTRYAVPMVQALLERDFHDDAPPGAALAHQLLLDALDRGDHHRFVVWPPNAPIGVLYTSSSGTAVPAGHPEAGQALAAGAVDDSWRVLVGPQAVGQAVIDASSRGLLRRKPNTREQRFMVARPDAGSDLLAPPGLRPAQLGDLHALTDYACALHVEDRMGPPIPRTGRSAVRERMHESVVSSRSWVIEADGRLVGKVDASLHSQRRGAQIAGVYVHPDWRGRGLAAAAVAALARRFLDEGLPGVTLHVRADNTSAQRAYMRAGFTDEGPWVLSLR